MLSTSVVFLPLIGSLLALLVNALFPSVEGKNNFSKSFCQIITTALVIASALISLKLFYSSIADPYYSDQINVLTSFLGNLNLNWAVKVDRLTLIMFVVVTLVSSLVHIYSVGYMHEDKSIARFMAYLSLFTFFMLILVAADNFVQLFFGWEGVGLASYLLIGFWFNKESANLAAMKAFITNRVGDFGLIIALALIYFTFGSLNYNEVFRATSLHLDDKFIFAGYAFRSLDAIAILLFIGAMGKSAQIGLHVWLADAMEGPTPVSALIHAATMVTAGVFLVARCSPIFETSEIALALVALVGAVTALFAATIALTQNDIKRIIAYSTCSQLGYMFFACGVSAYQGAIFHLATHAFFKALLFLGAGSVIHALHHEQDIRKMGGVYRELPITYALFWIGSLALAGFPPFAGFFSKDAILESAFAHGGIIGKTAFGFGIAAAFLTTFYSFRLLFLVFHGQKKNKHHSAHESPWIMLVPLLVLAVGAVLSGIIGVKLNFISAENNFFQNSIFTRDPELLELIHHVPTYVKLLPLVVILAGFGLAYLLYIKRPDLPAKLANTVKSLYNLSYNKWYFDEIYQKLLIGPTRSLGTIFWKIFDIKIIDGFGPNGTAQFSKVIAGKVSKIQTGYVYNYATAIAIGAIILIGFLISSFKIF